MDSVDWARGRPTERIALGRLIANERRTERRNLRYAEENRIAKMRARTRKKSAEK